MKKVPSQPTASGLNKIDMNSTITRLNGVSPPELKPQGFTRKEIVPNRRRSSLSAESSDTATCFPAPVSERIEPSPTGETPAESETAGTETKSEVPPVTAPEEELNFSRGTRDVMASWDEDPIEHQKAVREFMRQRIAEKRPIFPNRSLGFEYAAENSGTPRGFPVAAAAIANLRPGERIRWRGKWWTVQATTKAQLTLNSEGEVVRIKSDGKLWEGFQRDMEDALLAHVHGADTGAIMDEWLRDPIANHQAFAPTTPGPALQLTTPKTIKHEF